MNTTDVIIYILGLWTLRDIIAATGVIPHNQKYISNFFYGKFTRNYFKKILVELGYSGKKSERIIAGWKELGKLEKFKNSPQQLISILVNHTYHFKDEVFHGISDKTQSQIYINTMSAIHDHNNDHLAKLTNIFCELIRKKVENKSIKKPNFLICPKSGNTILALSVAKKLDLPIFFIKSKGDKSFVNIEYSEKPYDYFVSNIEGCYRFPNTLHSKIKKMTGIIVDCNTSSGSQLFESTHIFNDLIKNLKYNVEKIDNAIVLFTASEDIALQFLDDVGIQLHRYFDFDEETKEKLFSLKDDNNYFNYYDNKNDIDMLISNMPESNKHY